MDCPFLAESDHLRVAEVSSRCSLSLSPFWMLDRWDVYFGFHQKGCPSILLLVADVSTTPRSFPIAPFSCAKSSPCWSSQEQGFGPCASTVGGNAWLYYFAGGCSRERCPRGRESKTQEVLLICSVKSRDQLQGFPFMFACVNVPYAKQKTVLNSGRELLTVNFSVKISPSRLMIGD